MAMRAKFKWPLALMALAAPGLAVANAELAKLQKDPKQWVMPAGNFYNWRYSELKQINKDNVKNLRVAWTFSTGVLRGHEGGPLVIGDTLYLHTPFPNKVFAISLDDYSIKWKYEPKQDPSVIPVMCCDTVNRGLAYAEGKIFLQQADTTLVALDAKTGKVIWKAVNGNPKIGETNTNAPHVFKDKVFTGISGGEFGVRGFMAAYDINTGKLVWKCYSTGPDDEMCFDPDKTMTWTNGKMAPVGKDSSLKTWQGDQWKIGGGTTWGWYSYDPELNLMYYGSGNPSTWNPSQRPGDNKWSMTIFARDVDTGKAKWVYQMTPHDEWDYDGVNEMILADITVKGKKRKALVHFDRNGFAYTLDRVTGELLVAEKYDPKVNWATHVDMKTGRPQVVAKYATSKHTSPDRGPDINVKGICPAALGSKDQQPAAFNPKNGLFYVPTNHVCMDYEPFKVEYVAGQPYVGATLSMYPAPDSHGGMGNFIIWDADKGKIVASKPEKFSVWSGALVTAGDVAFYGTLDGYIKAVDTKDLKELWKFKTPSGIIGNITTWEYKGKQYIGVLSGIGGWAGIGLAAGLEKDTDGLGAVGGYKELARYTDLGGVLTVFSLP
ncbi:PQQ-dependent dehydrogenase, methanol/ethanol family [Pelomicrobium methylotrophicum]|uniref:PQQ-dependent dehydrogenase, methanol/ethanol family n=2 Tax=Pelomicrobium methylotrophicum TaxID=2602750 RepID=A0A5C7EWG7_9PROT|nr:methanol/ethanol family PQQ-dependent dehydrogenase [Pelomicrobium methylotrophicum]TXF12569.1 PQQ-dependent dehydrogenase, methanol/ethanol family [Pelomicrobium methylotrophicum]